ncbi:hypothetical protein [Wenjunlia tyrosinilytica]|uniref:Polymerase nucleotidyl transferase domain-containing protein n=1 Tax=Wenjunlia tyrosinilytica TaxID=1544741 RepID=A0A918DU33_9ACTN|nr:hypothetical protein [Wenjunlia tyrosinilytica]GGO82154.1 hypothetical protein GCM10012280_08070 [Wenjunlia tyrosinilytica]
MTYDMSGVVAELERRKLLPEHYDTVFASGSLIRGWGNPTSDLDVHVVTRDAWTSGIDETNHVALEPNTLQYEQIFVAGRRWDIEYWTASQVEQVLAKASTEQFDDDQGAWRTLSYHEIALLERLPYAAAADSGAWLEAVRGRLADSAHRSILIVNSLKQADSYTEDAAGQIARGDVHSAVIASRTAFNHAVDALTASLGQFGSLWPKWRARRMQILDPELLPFEEYWAIETMRSFDPENPQKWIEQTIAVCQTISTEVSV